MPLAETLIAILAAMTPQQIVSAIGVSAEVAKVVHEAVKRKKEAK